MVVFYDFLKLINDCLMKRKSPSTPLLHIDFRVALENFVKVLQEPIEIRKIECRCCVGNTFRSFKCPFIIYMQQDPDFRKQIRRLIRQTLTSWWSLFFCTFPHLLLRWWWESTLVYYPTIPKQKNISIFLGKRKIIFFSVIHFMKSQFQNSLFRIQNKPKSL